MTGGIKIKFGDKLRRIVIINPVRKLKMNLEISAISTKLSHQVKTKRILKLLSKSQKKKNLETSMTFKYSRRAQI
jgi:hypothetical protein